MADIRLLKPFLAAALLLGGGTAWAALGAQAPSPVPPGTSSTVAQTATGVRYTVHRRVLETGTTVQEYEDASGKVFAVSWSGPYLPDLRDLLGAHYTAFEQQGTATGRTTAIQVSRPEVLIQSAGRVGAFRGRAWLVRGLPTGLDPKGIR